MRDIDRFNYRGTFICPCCRRKTRDTTGSDFCGYCFEIMSLDNTVNDNGLKGTPEAVQYVKEAEKFLAKIAKTSPEGAARVRRQCRFLWPEEKRS